MIRLQDILTEIGDASAKAFPWKYHQSHPAASDQDFVYTWQGAKGQGIVTFVFTDYNEWDVAFGSVKANNQLDFSTLTDEGAFRVMATVMEIINDFLHDTYQKYIDAKELWGSTEPKRLTFSTAKDRGSSEAETSKRARLYQAYIQKQLPGSHVKRTDSDTAYDTYEITLQ